MSAILSFRTDDSVAESLDKLCDVTERDRTYHLTRAINRYLKAELWHAEAIQEGIADADAGRLTSLEDVKDKWLKKQNDSTDQ